MSAPAPDAALEPWVAALLAQAGLAGPFTLHELPGAGNSRVMRVQLAERAVLLKSYFRHPCDPRDRLGVEFSFLRFAWDHGLRLLPQPLAMDAAHGLGLYEFIEGRRLEEGEITEAHVTEAGALVIAINGLRHTDAARQLAPASEARFSIADQLALVAERLQRLAAFPVRDAEDAAGAQFVAAALAPAWARVRQAVDAHAAEVGLDAQAQLAPEARRLSPSDFGFHNTLLTPAGRLRFIDFEYAGWDDPAKMVCDLFCHPAMSVPPAAFEAFLADVLATGLAPATAWRNRVLSLLPVFRIKWCCIMLNDFLSVDSERYRFARRNIDPASRKRDQLRKAREALQRGVIGRAADRLLFSVA